MVQETVNDVMCLIIKHMKKIVVEISLKLYDRGLFSYGMKFAYYV